MYRLLFAILLLAVPAQAQQRDDLVSADGPVLCMARHGNALYIGGAFTLLALPTGSLVAVDPATGARTLPPLMVDGPVRVIVPDGVGGIYIGGTFQHVQGQPRANLARISGSGGLLPWNPGASGTVNAIARIGSSIYLGGVFDVVAGTARSNLAAVDTSGALLPWNPGANSSVTCLQSLNGVLYVGGGFTVLGGVARNRAGALDPVTGAVQGWDPNMGGPVLAMRMVYDRNALTTIGYLGGGFSMAAGQVRKSLAAVDATVGSPTFNRVTSWAPDPNALVTSLDVRAETGILYAGGNFTTMAGQPRNHVASFTGTTLNAWDPNATSVVNSLCVKKSTVYVGGSFDSLGTQFRLQAGAVNATGVAVTNAWDPQPWGAPYAIAVSGSNLWVGGNFTALGGVPRQGLAAIDLSSGQPTSWNPTPDHVVEAIEWIGDHLYFGGSFQHVNGQPRALVACVDEAGALSPWNPGMVGNEVSSIVSRPLDATTSVLYLGGNFFQVGPTFQYHLAAVTTTGANTPWNPLLQSGDVVRTLAIDSTDVYVGGVFSSIQGISGPNLARIGFASNVSTWSPSPPWVDRILLDGNAVYLGLEDNGGPPVPAHRSVRRYSKDSNAIDWTASTSGRMNALRGPQGLDVGGAFPLAAGASRNGLGRLDPASGLWSPWSPMPGANAEIEDLLEADGVLYVAGAFDAMSGSPRSNLAGLYDGVLPVSPSTSEGVALRAFPNPSSSRQVLQFELASPCHTRVALYDAAGRLVRVLVDGPLPAGVQRLAWDSTTIAPGLYFARLEAGSTVSTTKLLRVDR